jgi:hypothetical protein
MRPHRPLQLQRQGRARAPASDPAARLGDPRARDLAGTGHEAPAWPSRSPARGVRREHVSSTLNEHPDLVPYPARRILPAAPTKRGVSRRLPRPPTPAARQVTSAWASSRMFPPSSERSHSRKLTGKGLFLTFPPGPRMWNLWPLAPPSMQKVTLESAVETVAGVSVGGDAGRRP